MEVRGLERLLAAAAKSAPDDKADGAELRQLALACRGDALFRELKAKPDIEHVRAVLVATRPGLVTGAPSAQVASQLAALRQAAYTASLAVLGPQLLDQARGSQGEGGSAAATAALTERQAAELVCVLDTELSSVGGSANLAEIADAALEAFESDAPLGCAALELLPKALALLQAGGGQLNLPLKGEGGGNTSCQVSDVCKGFVRRVYEHSWPPACIGRILASLRSFPLTQESLQECVKMAVKRAKLADTQDLPAIVHQLLMLSTRGSRELILTEVMRLCEHREAALAGSANQLRQLLEVQGSVLLHMDMAAKHDAELGQAWVRQLRGEAPPRLSAFSLAVSFMLAGIQRFEQPVTDALKSLVLGAYSDAAALAGCSWLPQPSSGVAAAGGASQVVALRGALLQCARNTAHGQGGIVQPITALAVTLIEAGGAGSKGSTAAAAAAEAALQHTEGAALEDGGAALDDWCASSATPAQRAAGLGAQLLLELFEAHRDFRRDIIALCHNRLIGTREEVAAPYVCLLALLVRRNQATIGDYIGEMKLSLEHLAFLPPNAALALLLAVWPMCRARRDAQDYVVMLLRKAMFSRELHARLLAGRGFLYMITQELHRGDGGAALDDSGPGPSQVSMSQLSSLTGGAAGGATLLHEVMSFLRRCLTQQPEVRRVVYDGMPALLAADPSVQDCVAEPLLPHFLRFYETDEQLTPPLNLEATARIQGEGVRLAEPLHHLLVAVRRVLVATRAVSVRAADDSAVHFQDVGPDVSGSATAVLRAHFAALRRRLAECTLEDFTIDGATEFCLSTPSGQLGQANADVLLGCMEVAMEDLVEELTEGAQAAAGSGGGGAASQEEADVGVLGEALLSLHQQHRRLVDLATNGLRGKGNRADGQTQAGPGTRRGPGKPPTVPAAAAGSQTAPVVSVDQRVPAFSLTCLVKMLDAISDDGFKLAAASQLSGPATMAPTLKLCRDPGFITLTLTAAARHLQACKASELTAAIATGTAGSKADATCVCQLFAVPEWQLLARPLAVQTVVLAHCKNRPAAGAGLGAKDKKDAAEGLLTQTAMRALRQLLSMGAAGGLPGLAALAQQLPAPTAGAVEAAELPPAAGLNAAQQPVAACLPHFLELLEALLKPSCAKELEQLCGGLELLAGVLPTAFAGAVAEWAVGGLESVSGLTAQHVGAAKALLRLALAGKAGAAAAPARGDAGAGAGDDLELLLAVAQDVKGMINAEEMGQEGDRFAALTQRTYPGLLAVMGTHLDAVMGKLEWVLAKVRSLGAAARDASQGVAACQRLDATRQAWERAALLRLRKGAEILAVLAEARLSGAACEALVKSLTRLYKILGVASKAQLPHKGAGKEAAPVVSSTFSDLVCWVNKASTPAVYTFIQEVHGHEEEEEEEENEGGNQDNAGKKKASKRAKAAANKVKRESKQASSVPNLIFQIEEFERHLIRLSKAGKPCKVNLMVTARRATNRDFKLKMPAQRQESGEGGEERAKRQRREAEQQQEQQEEAAGESRLLLPAQEQEMEGTAPGEEEGGEGSQVTEEMDEE